MRHGVSSRSRRGIGVHGRRAVAPPRRAPRHRGRAGHGRLERGRLRVGAVPVAGCGLPVARLRAAAGGRPRRARRGLPRVAARPVAGDRGIARGHRRPRRRPRRRLPAPACRLRAVVRRNPHRTGAARSVRVRPSGAVPRRDRRSPPCRRPRLLSDDRVARARPAACTTGWWSRRASWSTPRPACRERDAARRSRACSRRSTRTSPPTASSRIAIPRRWRWRSRMSPNSRCRCCSRRTSCP